MIEGWHTIARSEVDTQQGLPHNPTRTRLAYKQDSNPTMTQSQPWLTDKTKLIPNQYHICLISRGFQTAHNREHDYHDSFTLYRGLCPIPMYRDFIIFWWLENLHVIMSAKHNHTLLKLQHLSTTGPITSHWMDDHNHHL
jgi:hypothetical protein